MYKVLIFSTLSLIVASEVTVPGIDRTLADGVRSRGYKIVYGDEDVAILNEVIGEMEKKDILKKEINLIEAIKPLPAEDVKCMMSVDRHCSKEMRRIKGVLIQALKNDCEKCSDDNKTKAGKVAASMMAHDPVAWKLFLTRCALQNKADKYKPSKSEKYKYKTVGKPEILSSNSRYTMPGVKVRVKRYSAAKIP